MRKLGIFLFILCTMNLCAYSAVVDDLQIKLSKVNSYSADFTQKVYNAKGKVVTTSKGVFMVKRPNLFSMETKEPDENLIIADGKTLWFYDPFVEQVTANWSKDVVDNSPIILLTSNDPEIWKQYKVSKQGNTYLLTPKSAGEIIKFSISFDSSDILKEFEIVYKNKQKNNYVLKNYTINSKIDSKNFVFKVPKGVELDDQRKK